MRTENKNIVERRKFFKTIGLSSLGIGLLSIYPIKLFANNKFSSKNIAIKIHPSAVKRNK